MSYRIQTRNIISHNLLNNEHFLLLISSTKYIFNGAKDQVNSCSMVVEALFEIVTQTIEGVTNRKYIAYQTFYPLIIDSNFVSVVTNSLNPYNVDIVVVVLEYHSLTRDTMKTMNPFR